MKTFFKHQKDFLKENPDKTALVWSCGTGKTRAALEWAKQYDNLIKTLVICPKSLKTNWGREAKMWKANVFIMTKEEFRRDHKKISGYGQVIVDEVHNGFLTPHFKSQMSKALRWYFKTYKTKRILLLSATVYSSSPWNIYNLAFYLGHKWDWQKFNIEFFNQIRMGMRIILVAKKGCEKRLAELTKKIASVVDIHDVMDVPLQNHCEPEYFSLTKKQEQTIKENYDPVPIVRYTKQHEIEQGILIGNEYMENQTFPCDKNERILDLVKENPKTALICRYNAQIDVLAGILADYKPFIIRGDVKNRDKVCLEAEKSKKAVVLIQADCAEGYQLPSFEVCVFTSQSYSYVKHEQICGRFLRMDKPSRTTFIYLLTEGDSIDKAIFNSVKRKEDFQINLYARKRLSNKIQSLA